MGSLDAMLSSTSKDLEHHRKRAEDACQRAGFKPNTMAYLSAESDSDAIDVSMRLVQESEVYVGIFGMCYGYRPNDPRNANDISITEMEYRKAKELGMPILIYIMSDHHPSPDTTGMSLKDRKKALDDFFESDPLGAEKLELLKKELTANHIVSFFDSADDLSMDILQSLSRPSLKEQTQKYYEKQQASVTSVDDSDTPEPAKSGIPHPPDLYAVPSYTGANETFVGRRDELQLLNTWGDPANKTPMLVLEAIGGMGKSALTWRWVQDRANQFDGVFWYSFYEGGAEMRAFVRHALAYVRRESPDKHKGKSVQVMMPELIHALQNGRYLLVLDGLERVLVAYHRWNAAQMQDDEVEEGKDYRDCTNPTDNDVLRQLVTANKSKVLITSRLMPNSLNDGGDPLNGVQHEKLRGLSRDDAQTLWREHGITWGDDGVMDAFVGQFGRHSLLLKLTVTVIKKDRRANGDFDAWYAINGETFNALKQAKMKRHHILKFAYDGLSDEAKTLLSQMAALGNAIEVETLNVFNPYMNLPDVLPKPRKPFLSSFDTDEQKAERQKNYEQRKQAYEDALQAKADYENSSDYKHAIRSFQVMLHDLEDRGLIWWDRRTRQYDLHPVVRGYAFAQLSETDKPDTYDNIYNYFEAQERGNTTTQFESYTEMGNIIAMYNALLGAGKFNEAALLFWDRLRTSLVEQGIGLYHKAYELLLPLFPNGLSELPIVSTETLQRYILNLMEVVLGYSGRTHDELLVIINKIQVDLASDSRDNLYVGLSNYSSTLRSNNQLAQAFKANNLAYDLIQLLEDKQAIAKSEYYLMSINCEIGRWEQAKTYYEAFIQHPPDSDWEISGKLFYIWTLIQQGANQGDIEVLLNDCIQLNQQVKSAWNRRSIFTFYGNLMLREDAYKQAIRYYSEAARIGNEQGVRDWEAWGGLARAYALDGNLHEALRIVEDGVDDHGWAAAVVHMKNAAQMTDDKLKATELKLAKEAAIEFYTRAWAQGEPYVWRWHLNQAKAILAELGVDEPQLEPWDESKYEPFEHEAEISALIEEMRAERDAQDSDDEGQP